MTTKGIVLLLAGVGLGVGLTVMGTLWYQIRTAPVKVELVQEKPTRVNDFDALNKSTSDKKMALEAMAAAEELVKEKLVAPSTARFSKEGAYLVDVPPGPFDCALGGIQKGKFACLEQFPPGTFTVTGTYDSQNSYGTFIRGTFDCHVVKDSLTLRWKALPTAFIARGRRLPDREGCWLH